MADGPESHPNRKDIAAFREALEHFRGKLPQLEIPAALPSDIAKELEALITNLEQAQAALRGLTGHTFELEIESMPPVEVDLPNKTRKVLTPAAIFKGFSTAQFRAYRYYLEGLSELGEEGEPPLNCRDIMCELAANGESNSVAQALMYLAFKGKNPDWSILFAKHMPAEPGRQVLEYVSDLYLLQESNWSYIENFSKKFEQIIFMLMLHAPEMSRKIINAKEGLFHSVVLGIFDDNFNTRKELLAILDAAFSSGPPPNRSGTKLCRDRNYRSLGQALFKL